MSRIKSATTILSTSPLSVHAEGYRKYLEGLEYRPHTISVHLSCVAAFDHLMGRNKLVIKDLDEGSVEWLLKKLNWRQSSKGWAPHIVRHFLGFLAERGILKSPITFGDPERLRLRHEYYEYLRVQRGLVDTSAYQCWRIAERFLNFTFKGKPVAVLKVAHIIQFIQHQVARRNPPRDKTLSSHLRRFFAFLFKSGRTKINLGDRIPSIKQNYAPRLPRHLTAQEVEKVVAAVRTDTPTTLRNRAMVLVMARLGLRATEVIAIQLDDIDWRAGEILIRGKGQLHDRLPIPKDVGKALAEYIKLERKSPSRALFVRHHAPRVGFTNAQLLNVVLKETFERAGIKPTPYVGSHILRHSLAVNMVRHGASLDEIGDILRHRSRSSTMIYARLDVDGLRSVAREWPVAGGAK